MAGSGCGPPGLSGPAWFFLERLPAAVIRITQGTADILFIVFTAVPFGLTGPVILASFAAMKFCGAFSGHLYVLSG
jgi:hypothetical protein